MKQGTGRLRLGWSALATGALLVATVPYASALTITGNFVAPGTAIPGGLGTATGAPANTAGGGSLTDIFNAAADLWELAILDPHAVTINFAWQSLSGSTLGVHTLLTQGGSPNRETSASIRFDSDGSSVFFMDATPSLNEEYGIFTESSADLGGGLINTGRVFTGASGSASGRTDLFSVVLHEIGHALGLSTANISFIGENADLDIDVVAPRPFPGTTIPTFSGAHLNIGTALMFPSIPTGMRTGQTAVDILANCEISDFNNCNLNAPFAVTGPSSLLVLLGGALGVGLLTRRRTL